MEIKRDTQSIYNVERAYVAHLIMNSELLKEVNSVLDPNLFDTQYCKILIRWIKEYYEKTELAPQEDMKSIFLAKSASLTPDEKDDVAQFLGNLAKDHTAGKLQSPSYNADSIIQYLKSQKIKTFQDKLDVLIAGGNTVEAENEIAKFERLERPAGHTIDPLFDAKEVFQAYNKEDEVLFRLPGDLGDALGDFLAGDMSGVIAPPKGYKSSCMGWIGAYAYKLGLNVLYINFEITKEQMMRRVWQSLFHLSSKKEPYERACFVKTSTGDFTIERFKYSPEHLMTDMTSICRMQDKLRLYGNNNIKFITYPRGQGYGIREIRADIENLILYEGWMPQLVIVDYADIVAPDRAIKDGLERDDAVWESLAGLAVKYNCHLLTGTQANRSAVNGKKYGGDAIGGSYRKRAHVSKMFCLSATPWEKEHNIGHIYLDEIRTEQGCRSDITYLTDLNIGCWCVDSKFTYKLVGNRQDEDD